MVVEAGTRFGSYEILAPLGAGGMGEVYRARDRKLDRDVAIKVLPQSVAAEPDRLVRFEREAKAVAALSHPNILAIYDFGSHEGVAYAVTELLEGETLRARLAAGPIPQKEAVNYALQVARGLSAAHEKGIVHRDLKPENLFVTRDSHVKILDFGLAKRTERMRPEDVTSAPTQEQQTEPGMVMGTVGYMSPEQVRGLPVDQRSDIFSLGAVLYELLTGRRAFQGSTPADTLSAILKEEPAELSEPGRAIPSSLDRVVRHCLEKDADARFQTSRDVAFALSEAGSSPAELARPARSWPQKRALTAAVMALVILSFATVLVLRRFPRGARVTGVKRIAVLPFENLGAPENDYFADGMADAVRNKLTSVQGIEVIARGSSVGYKKTSKTPRQIADELEARYLLTATVRWQKSGGASRVEVSPELVEVKQSGAPASKWGQPFDAALTDVFQVQADIATRVSQALGAAIGAADEQRLAENPTKNLAAYDAFLRGKEALKDPGAGWTPAYKKSLSFFEQAVALDPQFAQAWAGLSSACSWVYRQTPTPELADRARVAADRASALAPESPETYLAEGLYRHLVHDDLPGALEQFSKGHRIAPGNPELVLNMGITEGGLERREEAVDHYRLAERLDPRSTDPKLFLGAELFNAGRFGEARQVFDRALALAPSNLTLIQWKAQMRLVEGDLAGARAVLETVPREVEPTELVAYMANYGDFGWVLDESQRKILLRLTPSAFGDDRASWALCLAQAYAWEDDAANVRRYADVARAAFEERLRGSPDDHPSRALLGLALAYLGRKVEAIREGLRAFEPPRPPKREQYERHQLVRIYILCGEQEKALDGLESLLRISYELTPGMLRIDPNFDPLRKNPRFQRLVGETK